MIREIRKQKQILVDLKRETVEAEKIVQGRHDPAEYRKATEYERMTELEQEIKVLPSRDIAAHLLETAKQIHGVAIKSSNMKGTMVKVLKDAAIMVQVGVDAISGRLAPREGAEQRELSEIREELKRVCIERDMLKKMAVPLKDTPPVVQENKNSTWNEEGGVETVVANEEEKNTTHKSTTKFVKPSPAFLREEKRRCPAIRPAIMGKAKVMEDSSQNEEEDQPSPGNKKKRGERQHNPINIESMEAGFNTFLESINNKMKDMFSNFIKGLTKEQTRERGGKKNSSRYKSDAPASRGSVTSDRPAPVQGKGKGRKEVIRDDPRSTAVQTMSESEPTL